MIDSMDKVLPNFLNVVSSMSSISTDSNNSHFNSKYASLESVITFIKLALHKNNLCFTQNIIHAEGNDLLILDIYHSSGQKICFGPLRIPAKSTTNPQDMKSGITYMRRTQLLTVFGLAEVDDDGQGERPFEPSKPAPQRLPKAPIASGAAIELSKKPLNYAPQKASADLVNKIMDLAKSKGLDSTFIVNMMTVKFGIKHSSNLLKHQAEDILKSITEIKS